jgi:hypothetical protein
MLFGTNPAKMTVEEQLEYLVRKLGSRFMAPMFRAGFTHLTSRPCWHGQLASVAPARDTWRSYTAS